MHFIDLINWSSISGPKLDSETEKLQIEPPCVWPHNQGPVLLVMLTPHPTCWCYTWTLPKAPVLLVTLAHVCQQAPLRGLFYTKGPAYHILRKSCPPNNWSHCLQFRYPAWKEHRISRGLWDPFPAYHHQSLWWSHEATCFVQQPHR